jgi:pyruvate dehydrogenase E2 component (dihydrolipoamide acetyltransferase)
MLIHVPQTLQGSKSATVRRWCKQTGEAVKAGETVVELELEDSLIQLKAGADGALGKIAVEAGRTVPAGTELGLFEPGAAGQSVKLVAQASGAKQPPDSATSKAATPAESTGSGVAIAMPQAGNTMEEGTILKWRVKVGDKVAVGQVLCEIETDKATVEFESTDAGTIAWLAAEGSVIPVKQPIAYLGEAPGQGGAATEPSGASVVAPAAARTPVPVPAEAVAAARVSDNVAVPAGVVPILMPQAGNTMEEGTIVKWRVKEGDQIAVGQVIAEIETDKATVEFEATDSGRVAKIVAPEGSVVPVKQPMAYLAENDVHLNAYLGAGGAAPATRPAAAAAPAPSAHAATAFVAQAAHAPAARTESGRVKASPAARKLAAERGIDLRSIGSGSGPEGRILSTDLAGAKAAAPSPRQVAAAAPVAASPAKGGEKAAVVSVPMATLSSGRRALSKMRKAIATNLQTSKQTVPHFYVRGTINADPLFAYYKAQKPATGCTLNDVILLAVGRVIGEFPAFRSRIEGNEIVELPAANVGVAVSVPDGLVVPVVLNVQGLTLGQLAPESKRIVESARNGKIENMGKGVFTISNMGMLGVEEFAAIINPPESGILAVSSVREAVIVKEGSMRAGRVMTMTLSVDHRVVDGALAAQFMARLKELLEAPEALLQ